MNLYYSIQYFLYGFLGFIYSYNANIKTNSYLSNNLFDVHNIDKKIIYHNLKKTSLLSKMIYDFDITNINDKNNKIVEKYVENENIILKYLDENYFFKDNDIYQNLLYNYFPSKDILGYINHNKIYSIILLDHQKKEINTIFRGSNYVDEWIQNLNLFETNLDFFPEYKIHSGIYNMYKYENSDKIIINILKKIFIEYPNYKKIFCGHSKASCNSILTAFQILNDKEFMENVIHKELTVYCYGSPPIFNLDFAKKIFHTPYLNIFNVINETDIIPNLPYKYHVGHEVFINKKNIIINNKINPYKYDNNINYNTIFDGISNHDLNKYINNIVNF
jgi:hypothetical protein